MRLGSRLALGAIVMCTAVSVCASAASAGSLLGLDNYCGTATKPFGQFGDARLYTFGTNGGLEAGSAGWSVSGASVVAGNESYYVHSRGDSHSLSLPGGATATTPPLCMGTTSTVVRFFDRSANGGSVKVQVVMRGLLGQVVGVLDWTTVKGSSSWQPSPSLVNLDSLLGLLGVSSIQLKFSALAGTTQVDDVYVDPWWSRD
jgi:hypothetical protein